MRREIVRGLVKKIEPIHSLLSFVTLSPIEDEVWVETRVPVYMELKEREHYLFIDKPVDIITTRSGLLGRKISQKISGSNFSYSVELTQSQVDAITSDYNQRLRNQTSAQTITP